MNKVPCPRCGFMNAEGASYCTLCQTIFRRERSAGAAAGAAPRAAPPGPSRPAALESPRAAGAPEPSRAVSAPGSVAPGPRGPRRDFLAEQGRNRLQSWLLMSVFVVLIGALGSAIGGAYGSARAGALLAALAAGLSAAGAWFAGDRMLLAASGARQVTSAEEPQLHNVVEELCVASGLPKPALYVIESEAPNAFATGRSPDRAAIAVTRGLLVKMSRDQLQGVLAHEMSHVRNLDVRFAMLVGVLVGTVALISDGWLRGVRVSSGRRWSRGSGLMAIVALLLAIVAPFASLLIQMAISRRRELLADASAVELTRNPLGLAGALRVIGSDPAPLETASRATQHLYIANPLRAAGMRSSALFSTHPPIEARIRILESMA